MVEASKNKINQENQEDRARNMEEEMKDGFIKGACYTDIP